jgi:hypothetical protein
MKPSTVKRVRRVEQNEIRIRRIERRKKKRK